MSDNAGKAGLERQEYHVTDIYDDARLSDALAGVMGGGSDLGYWSQQCSHYGGPALELACGSGRLTVPLAGQGVAIEGLDLSAGMLAVAEEKSVAHGKSIPWHHADMTNFDLGRRYSTIFLPVNSIAHLLHWRDLANCLACVRRHLAEDGHFLVDYFNPALGVLLRDSGGKYPVGEFAHPDDGTQVIVTESNVYDTAT
jgi:SAM-dependent methyltransferase